jgi:hypothetical protein
LAAAGVLRRAHPHLRRPDRLIATGDRRDLEKNDRAAVDGGGGAEDATGTAIAAMTARPAITDGITAYRQRSHIAEIPYGHIKHNMASAI